MPANADDTRLEEAIAALRDWQDDGAPMQLHPGDLGWFRRFGREATAAAVRTWMRDGRMLAVGLLDGPGLLRLAIAPDSPQDEDLAHRLLDDVSRPASSLEAPEGALVRDLLVERGWEVGEPWTQLRRDLVEPVELPPARIQVVGPAEAELRSALQRAAFERSTFTEKRWRAMASGPAYAEARCLIVRDDRDTAVGVATVWSAGPGRPGLVEPMGVHRDHRRRGHGKSITLAAAAALREMGSSSAIVSTTSANIGAVTTYRSAGFQELAVVRDLDQPSSGKRARAA